MDRWIIVPADLLVVRIAPLTSRAVQFRARICPCYTPGYLARKTPATLDDRWFDDRDNDGNDGGRSVGRVIDSRRLSEPFRRRKG